GANTAKMPRPRFTLEHIRKRILFHEDRSIVRIHLRGARSEQKIDIYLPAELFVFLFGSRISFVIAPWFELKRIHENAYDDLALLAHVLARNSNQFAMRLVQRPH